MTEKVAPRFDELMSKLDGLSSKLAGPEGKALREHLQQLAQIVATQGEAKGSDAEMRARGAAALEQLIGGIAALGALRGPGAKPIRGLNFEKIVDGLRTFAEFLRTPTGDKQAQVEKLIEDLQGAPAATPATPIRPVTPVTPARPVPLDELQIDDTVEAIAEESARRHGLAGVELEHAVARMKRHVESLVKRLELRARDEAQRARTASEMERLIDKLIESGTALGQAVAREREAIVEAFRSVDLAHMADGLKVLGAWLSTHADDVKAHVAELRERFLAALGPPTAGDPARSDDERRADFEREIKDAVDQIFRGPGQAPS